jgi:predicted metal-dependent peptidase
MQESLTKICKQIMLEQPFYGLLLLNLQKEWNSKKIKTAGVGLQGINYKLYINPEFWSTLTDDERKGLIIHELMHIAFFHITDYKHLKNHDLANQAQDIEINQKIDDKYLPANGCTIDKYPAHYNLLPNEGTNKYYEKLNEQQEGGDETMQKIMQAMSNAKNQQQNDGDNSNGPKGNNPGQVDMNGKPMQTPDHQWDEVSDLSEAQKKLVDRQLATIMQDAIEQVKKSRGTYPREIEERIGAILNVEPPKFNWKAYLRRFIGNSIKTSVRKTKRKKSKRFEHDFGIRIHEHSHILIGIDSSASVSTPEIMEFLGEIKHMYKTGHDFTLIFADTEMQEPIKYNPKKELVIKKRGGTDFNPIVDYYHHHRNRFSTLIYLTDGEAPLPDNPVKNMLWVLSTISGDADHLKQSGKVIKLN